MACSTGKKRSAPDSEGSAATTAIKRRRRTDFGNSSMITRSQTLSAARNAVLHTTELLENILYFLPMKDLLFAQKVCMKWRELIQRSIPLQAALFLRPRELNVSWKLVPRLDQPPKLVKIDKKQCRQSLTEEAFGAAIPNPLLCKIDMHSTWRVENALTLRPGDIWFRARPSAVRPEASWRRMLIAHAPSCQFEYYYERFEHPRQGRSIVSDIEIFTSPEQAHSGDIVALVERAEAKGEDLVDWGAHVMTFEGVLFTMERELEMDELE